MLKELLAHPFTRGLDLDDPETTALRRRINQEKHFLHALYREWYAELMAAIPAADNCPGNDMELDDRKLPFRPASHLAIYLASGDVSMRALAPGITYRALRGMERALGPLLNACAMFAHIVVRRIGGADDATHGGQRGCGSSC